MAIMIPPPSINNQRGAVLSLEYAILSVIAVMSAFTMGAGVHQYINRINQQFMATTDEFVEDLFNQDFASGQQTGSHSDGDLPRSLMSNSNRYASTTDLWTHIS